MASYEINICPLKRLYQYAEDGEMDNVAVLAVSSYDVDQEKLNVFCNALCLNFADVSNNTDSFAFSIDIAEMVANYIKGLPKQLDTLFVSCDSGESRSASMAAAIMRYKGFDEMRVWENPHYHPNPLVYSLLCDALGVPVSEIELQVKCWISKKALADAIKQN